MTRCAAEAVDRARPGSESMPEYVDVLIVGSGPAGLTIRMRFHPAPVIRLAAAKHLALST